MISTRIGKDVINYLKVLEGAGFIKIESKK